MSAASSGRTRLALPLSVPLAALGAGLLVRAVPLSSGLYPSCPIHSLTGLWCSGCGATRLVAALAEGDLLAAADHNLLLLTALPLLAALWLVWLGRSLGIALALPRPTPARVWTLVGIALVFGVVRNLPFATFLAPT